jgi:hypothetical protein
LLPFSAPSNGGPVHPGLPHLAPSAFRVSRPLDGLLPPLPSGLVSCRSRSWGFVSRAFPPERSLQPLSSLASLLALVLTQPKPRLFLTFRALTPRRDSTPTQQLLTPAQAATLMTFHSLGNSPEPPWRRFRFASPLELLQTHSLRRNAGCPAGSYETARLAGLSRDCRPL